jgi:hypothetical protein
VSSKGICRECEGEFCEECLVYAFGEGRAPYCIDCAVAASTHRRPSGEIDLREVDAKNC